MIFELLPELSTDEFAALKADIDLNGVRDPIWVDEDGAILDGHHRAKIQPDCPRRVITGLTQAEKKAFAYRANFVRRNLSPEQKSALRKQMKEVALELNAEGKTQTEIGKLLGVAQQTVGYWLSIPNTKVGIRYRPTDSRQKLRPEGKEALFEMAEAGEKTQEEIAAEFKISQAHVSRVANQERKRQEAARKRQEMIENAPVDSSIVEGDFREVGDVLENDSVDLILTDPPYSDDSLELYEALSLFASRVLKPGSICLAYSGQHSLPEIYAALYSHLDYMWTFAIRHTGGELRFRKYHLHNAWKPVLAYYKPPLTAWWNWFSDMTSGGKEKESHEWQQAEAEAAHFIASLCPRGGLVLDPFCGSGTTLIAAKRLNRNYWGFETDPETAALARSRVNDARI